MQWDSHGEGGEDGVFNQQGHRHRLQVILLTKTEETILVTTLCATVIFTDYVRASITTDNYKATLNFTMRNSYKMLHRRINTVHRCKGNTMMHQC